MTPGAVEEIASGAVNVAHEGTGDFARWAALSANFPNHVPDYTVNGFCVSSLTATTNLANSIAVGKLMPTLAKPLLGASVRFEDGDRLKSPQPNRELRLP